MIPAATGAKESSEATIPANSTLQKALSLMISNSLNKLDVIDKDGALTGHIYLDDITKIMNQGRV